MLDLAGNFLMPRVNHALGGKLLQDLHAAAAGVDEIPAVPLPVQVSWSMLCVTMLV
jgi:hypothetical protein